MTMKKLFLSLLVLCGVCITLNAQTPYKVLEVYKDGKVTHTHKLSDIDSLTVRTVGETPDTPVLPDIDPNHEYVDLGLPSGTLWATCNVGASSPEDYGDYFAWGETSPKTTYSWSTYKWGNDWDNLFKYNTSSSYGTVDNRTVLEPSDDAATVNWGSGWRMPTYAELDELSQYCTWTWTTLNGVNGQLVVGPNGNSLFLPAAGYRYVASLLVAGSNGYYWSSSLYSVSPLFACYLYFSSGYHNWNYNYRYYGRSVRPVRASAWN